MVLRVQHGPVVEAADPNQEGKALNDKAIIPVNGRQSSVFTPMVVQQIKNLVERGKSREEIAEILNTTPGSLSATCSKLGVSLRRPAHLRGIRVAPVPPRVTIVPSVKVEAPPEAEVPSTSKQEAEVAESNIPELLRVERALREKRNGLLKRAEEITQQLAGIEMARKALQHCK